MFSNITLGDLFVSLFLLSLICASISTISALMHTIGVAGGYDVFSVIRAKKTGENKDADSINVNRIVTMIMMVLVVVYCYLMPKDIIAKATSLFMGVTAAALLPAYVHALYSKRPSRKAAVASITVGTVVYMFWALFISKSMSVFLPICETITGKKVLFDGLIQFVDPLVIALPISIITMAVCLLIEKKATQEEPVAETA